MLRLLLATHNHGKQKELQALLGGLVSVQTLDDYPEVQMPEETGTTYAANASLKVQAVREHTHRYVLADDSGLEVMALPGQLGVKSARYTTGSDADRVQKLLQALEGVEDRRAMFVSVLAFDSPQTSQIKLFRGELHGTISLHPRGEHGFGYDPVFVPLGSKQSLAEMGMLEKNALSHRAQALQKFRAWLIEQPFMQKESHV